MANALNGAQQRKNNFIILRIILARIGKKSLLRGETRNGFRFCWCKNFTIYLRQTEDSRPIQFKTLDELERFARQESLPLS